MAFDYKEFVDLPTASVPLSGSEVVVLVQGGNTVRAAIGDTVILNSYLKTALPAASPPGQLIYVTNEVGGAVPAFSDGTNWRRVTDRAIVS